jgi:hypothetical protein
MKTIKIKDLSEIPENFTGIVHFLSETKEWYKEGKLHREDGPAVEYPSGTKEWYKEGKRHREEGPACEFSNGYKQWWLESECYSHINLNDYIILDYYEGKCNLMWYKLLNKDKIIECPDIPGLIEK